MSDLRPYQLQAIEEIRAYYRAGKKRILLWLPTGAGKTHTFCYVIRETVHNKKRAMVLVRGRKLVSQASARLWHEDTTHGVLMANHWNNRPTAPVQVCSIDTLMARGTRPQADIIIIDEAHQAVSDGYREVLADYPNAYVLAVTATPYAAKGLRHLADEIVHPITVGELIEQGFLVDGRYYGPSEPNLDGVKISRSTGDYVVDQLAEVMGASTLMGDVVGHWTKLAADRPTLAFAVNVRHSKNIADAFNQSGIPAAHADAETPEKEREELVAKLCRGDIKVISNVGIFCTGVDIPPLSCGISARPTQSYNLYIQQVGRLTRPFPGKREWLWIDHAGNVTRHGFWNQERPADLDGIVDDEIRGPKPKLCKRCFAMNAEWPCALCGWTPPPQERGPQVITEKAGELCEIKAPRPLEIALAREFCDEELQKCVQSGRSPWSAFYATKNKFGEKEAQAVFFSLCKLRGINTRKGAPSSVEFAGLVQVEEGKKDGWPFK